MGRGINRVKKNFFKGAAVAGIVVLFVLMTGCPADPSDTISQDELCDGIIELPKTGQTASYITGDDGHLRMGVAWPDPRFTDNGDGTITDHLTGLIWIKDGNRFGQRTWAQALSDCNGLADDGTNLTDGSNAGDWRLPNRKELRSLVNYAQSDQSVWLNDPTGIFSGVQADYYWSSTTFAQSTFHAWYVKMNSGDVSIINKATIYYVLAVRSGQTEGAVSLPKTGQTTMNATGDDGDLEMGVAWPSPRFTDNGDGTICDKLTGLMWEQAPSGTTQDWTDALTYANNLDLGGHSDWRLPNVWLNGQGFSGVQAGYWSSTTYAPNTSNAWYVSMSSGNVSNIIKTNNYYVIAVRSGQ
jgi:hypothetical protein